MAEVPRNIQIFDHIVALALSDLYQSFPVPVDLEPSEIGARACEGFTDEGEEIFDIITGTARDAISFLAEEGLFRYNDEAINIGSNAFPQARLSLRGLALLGKVPQGIGESRETLGTQIRTAANQGASNYLSGLVGQVFNFAMESGWNALTGLR